jgi:hypothetical protein
VLTLVLAGARARRFELSEEDRALITNMHDAVIKRSDRQEELLHEVLRKLNLTQLSASDVSDERRELDAPDMEAKERAFLEQICALLESTAHATPAAPPGAAGTNPSRFVRGRRLAPAVASPSSPCTELDVSIARGEVRQAAVAVRRFGFRTCRRPSSVASRWR